MLWEALDVADVGQHSMAVCAQATDLHQARDAFVLSGLAPIAVGLSVALRGGLAEPADDGSAYGPPWAAEGRDWRPAAVKSDDSGHCSLWRWPCGAGSSLPCSATAARPDGRSGPVHGPARVTQTSQIRSPANNCARARASTLSFLMRASAISLVL